MFVSFANASEASGRVGCAVCSCACLCMCTYGQNYQSTNKGASWNPWHFSMQIGMAAAKS